jgi:HAD superfamily hydrolase (TIGR01509 family)
VNSTDAVFFDFAGTLFSDRALREVHLAQLHFVADQIGVARSDSDLRAAYRTGMGVAYRSIATRPYYLHRELFGAAFAAMAPVLGGELDTAQIEHAVDRQYRATIDGAELRDDCLETLASLRDLGVHVQIVSNIDAEQLTGLMSKFQLGHAVDAWTSSEEAGSCKPDPGIFRLALHKADRDPDRVLFVGDSPTHDVEGPRAIGMRTALLVADSPNREPATAADFTIKRLGDVISIMEGERVT